jgi:hypothetical protein
MIKNTVASKSLISIDLGDFYPKEEDCAYFDIKDFLFKGLILKEDDFRKQIENINWQDFEAKYVGLFCTADAIVPMWVYMILASHLSNIAKTVCFGKKDDFPLLFLHKEIDCIDTKPFEDKRVVIKGCGEKRIDEEAFTRISFKLGKVTRSILYGEPCSTVPVFKRSID